MGGLAIMRLKGGGNGARPSVRHSQSAQSCPCLLYYIQLTQWSLVKQKMNSVPPSLAFPYNHRILQILNPAYDPTGPGPAGFSLLIPLQTCSSLCCPHHRTACVPLRALYFLLLVLRLLWSSPGHFFPISQTFLQRSLLRGAFSGHLAQAAPDAPPTWPSRTWWYLAYSLTCVFAVQCPDGLAVPGDQEHTGTPGLEPAGCSVSGRTEQESYTPDLSCLLFVPLRRGQTG